MKARESVWTAKRGTNRWNEGRVDGWILKKYMWDGRKDKKQDKKWQEISPSRYMTRSNQIGVPQTLPVDCYYGPLVTWVRLQMSSCSPSQGSGIPIWESRLDQIIQTRSDQQICPFERWHPCLLAARSHQPIYLWPQASIKRFEVSWDGRHCNPFSSWYPQGAPAISWTHPSQVSQPLPQSWRWRWPLGAYYPAARALQSSHLSCKT